jgi:hypothetical protein
MSRFTRRYGPLLLASLPVLAAIIAGVLEWIWQPGFSALTWYTSVWALVGWAVALGLLIRWTNRKKLFPHPSITIPPGASRHDEEAWKIIRQAEARLDEQLAAIPGVDDRIKLLGLTLEELAMSIAQVYRPGVSRPYSDRTVIEILSMVGLSARSLRHWLTCAIPGVGLLSVGEAQLLMGVSDLYRKRQIQIDRIAAAVSGSLLLISGLVGLAFDSEVGLVMARGMFGFLLLVVIPRFFWRQCHDRISKEFMHAALLQMGGEAGSLLIELSNGGLRKGTQAHVELQRQLAATRPKERAILPTTWRLWLIYSLLVVPYAWLGIVGTYALVIDHWWIPLALLAAISWGIAWVWWRSLRAGNTSPEKIGRIEQQVADFARNQPWPPLRTPEPYLDDHRQLMQLVGRELGSRGRHSLEDLTLPEGLRAVERLAIDIEQVVASWPLSTMLTIGQAETWLTRANQAQQSYEQSKPMLDTLGKTWNATRWLRALTPADIVKNIGWAIAADLAGSFASHSRARLEDWVRGQYVLLWRLAGSRLIDAQTGHWRPAPLVLRGDGDSMEFVEQTSTAETDTSASGAGHQPASGSSPLDGKKSVTLAVVGQVKAGKSSLINAVLRQHAALVDVLPATSGVSAYRCTLPFSDGEVTLLDTPGYTDASLSPKQFQTILDAARTAEVVLLVMAANTPAKEPDVRLIQRLRDHFDQHPGERQPILVGVVSKVDLLRPMLEWSPPYQFLSSTSSRPKEVSVRETLDYHRQLLGQLIPHWIPVATRIESSASEGASQASNRLFGIDEYLLPLLVAQLPEAQGLLLLKAHHARQTGWQSWWDTARTEGTKLIKILEATTQR